MHPPPLLQSELSFSGRRHDDVHEWIRERRKPRWQRMGDWVCTRILLPTLGILMAVNARVIPAPVWSIGSMLISIAIYSSRMGWRLATGFIILLMIHECGHLLAARYYGSRTSVPIFIPFIGAIIDMKQPMRSAWEEAVFGISGPILGSAGAFACLAIHHLTGNFYFAELAFFGFFLNLFNLIPVGFLDGGHVAVALTRWLWVPGYLMMIAFVCFTHAPVAIIAVFIMLPMVLSLFWRKQGKRSDARILDYDRISVARRICMGALYVGLIAVLISSMGLVWCWDIAPGLHSGQSLFPHSVPPSPPLTAQDATKTILIASSM